MKFDTCSVFTLKLSLIFAVFFSTTGNISKVS